MLRIADFFIHLPHLPGKLWDVLRKLKEADLEDVTEATKHNKGRTADEVRSNTNT